VSAETLVLIVASDWRPQGRYSHAYCRDLIGFAFPVIGSSFWSILNDELPKSALGAFLGPAAVGIYALARRPLELLTSSLINPMAGVAMPSVSRMQADVEAVNGFYDRSVRIAALIGFPAFMGLAAIAPEVVPMVLGPEWIASVPAVQIIMLLGLVRTIDSILAGVALGFGQSALLLYMNIAYTVLIGVLLVIAAQISVEATMLAIVLCNVLLLPAMLYFTRRLTGVDVLRPLASFPLIGLCTAVMVGAVTGWRDLMAGSLPLWALVASAIAVGVAAYAAAAAIVLRRDLMNARDVVARMSL
jgi:O-antigen/teichoic acid export membrane protein